MCDSENISGALAPFLSSGQKPIGADALRLNSIFTDNWHQLGQDTNTKGVLNRRSAFFFL